MPSIEKIFAADLAAAEGHFPGNPIIPGAYLLSAALAAVAAELGWEVSACAIKAAKFLTACHPGERMLIDYAAEAGGALKLECTVGGVSVLSARIACQMPARQAPA